MTATILASANAYHVGCMPTTSRRSSPLVLVADDHDDSRTIARLVLETAGWRVIEARTGPETLRLVVSNLKKAVLREGYFEHLDLTFAFKREGEWTQVSFIMDGKYGKVVQWTAFDDRYKSMIPDYQNEVGQFIIFMGDKIINLGK